MWLAWVVLTQTLLPTFFRLWVFFKCDLFVITTTDVKASASDVYSSARHYLRQGRLLSAVTTVRVVCFSGDDVTSEYATPCQVPLDCFHMPTEVGSLMTSLKCRQPDEVAVDQMRQLAQEVSETIVWWERATKRSPDRVELQPHPVTQPPSDPAIVIVLFTNFCRWLQPHPKLWEFLFWRRYFEAKQKEKVEICGGARAVPRGTRERDDCSKRPPLSAPEARRKSQRSNLATTEKHRLAMYSLKSRQCSTPRLVKLNK